MSDKLIPPGNLARFTGLHWLQQVWYGSAGTPPYVALQWNPASKTWTHSDGGGTCADPIEVTTQNYRYVKPIPLPELGE